MTDRQTVRAELERRAALREHLRANPRLRFLFFELCDACNLSCLHCGSSCGPQRGSFIDPALVDSVLREVRGAIGTKGVLVCITGGEPLVHPQFFEIVEHIRDLGFSWGMTTNATLIGDEEARRLVDAGMRTVAVSLDGPQEVHDAFRGRPGAYDRAVRGVRAMNAITPVEVVTVVHRQCYPHLGQMYDDLLALSVPAWRIVSIEPMGRALDHPELMLDRRQFAGVLDFIEGKRNDPQVKMIVSYGCSHYLGPGRELSVREQCFLCGAGLWVASVTFDGDIYGCLDVERRPELVQGNVAKGDSFVEAWKNGFGRFRTSRAASSATCRDCPSARWCDGDSAHTWDFDNNEPLLCAERLLGGLGRPGAK